MRLNPFDTNKIDVRGGGGGRAGKLGCGAIVIAAIGSLVFGTDFVSTLGTVQSIDQATTSSRGSDMSEQELCSQNEYSREACSALQSLNQTWEPEFREANIEFRQPSLTFYSGRVRSGCGAASSAAGPFYCPADMGIYIDTSFYDQLARLSGERGDFARLYVMAHEYGHHIQKLTGIADQIRSAQQQNPRRANDLQVRMELQADCYAGVWAAKNRDKVEQGDLEEGMNAAAAIGDDTIMERAGQRANPENFTHGSSAQRMQWLRRGFSTQDEDQCDTFADLRS